MPTILTLFQTVLRKLTPAEVDQNFMNLRTNVDKLGGFSASQSAAANQIPVLAGDSRLVLPAGIAFPATQVVSNDPNTLDDCEKGTWTPTLYGTTAAGAGTYTIQLGRYTKIGRIVFITMRVTWTAHTGTGAMRISGLPFQSAGGVHVLSPYSSGLTVGNNGVNRQLAPFISQAQTYVTVGCIDTTGGGTPQFDMDTAADLMITGFYEST